MVTIFRFKRYDISSDEFQHSRRWATRDAIERIGAEVLDDHGVDVDPSVLNGDGMTERNFNPHLRQGFQTYVSD